MAVVTLVVAHNWTRAIESVLGSMAIPIGGLGSLLACQAGSYRTHHGQHGRRSEFLNLIAVADQRELAHKRFHNAFMVTP